MEKVTSISKRVRSMELIKFEIPEDYDCGNIKNFKDKLVDRVNKKGFHFVFMGAVGCGKTKLARLIQTFIGRIGETMVYSNCWGLYREYLRDLREPNSDPYSRFDRLMETDNIILDDIGAEQPSTPQSHGFIATLIEIRYTYLTRYKSMTEKTNTIICTNLSFEGESNSLQSYYGDRVVDRIVEMCTIVKFGGHSYRVSKKEVL